MRSSSKQQLRGWLGHLYAAMPLPEDNCIFPNEVVPS